MKKSLESGVKGGRDGTGVRQFEERRQVEERSSVLEGGEDAVKELHD